MKNYISINISGIENTIFILKNSIINKKQKIFSLQLVDRQVSKNNVNIFL